MARSAREKSESGFYHVIIRGIGKQILFEDDEDYYRFLDTLKRYRDELKTEIHAYCLMENHVHLLIRDTHNELDVFMKKVQGSYAFYFNHKYERVGTLFQDRFKSQPVDSDAYFAVVLRYILQNPEKAGICKTDVYPWSSYQETVNGGGIVCTDFAMEIFGSRKLLQEYVLAANDDQCMEPAPPPISDSHAQKIIREKLKIENGTVLQTFSKETRDNALRILKDTGLSVRQIERLTGISRGIILKA